MNKIRNDYYIRKGLEVAPILNKIEIYRRKDRFWSYTKTSVESQSKGSPLNCDSTNKDKSRKRWIEAGTGFITLNHIWDDGDNDMVTWGRNPLIQSNTQDVLPNQSLLAFISFNNMKIF